MGESVGRSPEDFLRSRCGIFRNYRADHADRFFTQRSQLVQERYANTQQIQFDDSLQNFFAQINRVSQSGGGKTLIHNDNAPRGSLSENIVNPNKIVLKFASKIFDVFLSFEMRKELVEQEKLCCSTRDWTTDAGQKMQLPERPGEGRFA